MLSFPGACTNPSFLVCLLMWTSGTATATVADPTNGAWVPIGPPVVGVGGMAGTSQQIFYLPHNRATSALTVTATFTASVVANIAIHEYTGAADYAPVGHSYSTPNSATPTSGSLTPTTSSDFAVAHIQPATSISSVNLPYTWREHGASIGGGATADNLSLVGGTPTSVTFNESAGDNDLTFAVFTPAAAGAGRLLVGVG